MELYSAGSTIAGRYEVIGPPLGGGMGTIYRCIDLEEGVPLVLKTFQKKFLYSPPMRQHFIDEAHSWIALGSHPNIVQAYGLLIEGEYPYIMLEYIVSDDSNDPSLSARMDQGPLPLSTALEFALHLLQGMAYATERVPSLVHRDLKPANLLIGPGGILKITDFGLVKSLDQVASDGNSLQFSADSQSARAGGIVGTPPYMAPEQCAGKEATEQSDIYAFGCILYEMLCGKGIFKCFTSPQWLAAHQNDIPTPLREYYPEIPTALNDLVMACLEKDRTNRPASFKSILPILSHIYEDAIGKKPVLSEPISQPAGLAQNRGLALLKLGFPKDALIFLEEATARQPDLDIIWNNKGNAHYELNEYGKALDCYEHALALNPNYVKAKLGRALTLLASGTSPISILPMVEEIVDLTPDLIAGLELQAGMLSQLDRYEEARRCQNRILRLTPTAPSEWVTRGRIMSSLGRVDEALPCFDRALSLNPRLISAWLEKGITLSMMGNMAAAQECREAIDRLDPDWFDQHTEDAGNTSESIQRKIVWFIWTGQFEAGIEICDRALSSSTDDVSFLCMRAQLLSSLGRQAEAISTLLKVIEIEPNKANNWFSLAEELSVAGYIDDAISNYRKALDLDPDFSLAWNNLGDMLNNKGCFDDAIPCLRKAVALDSTYLLAWVNLGIALRRTGRTKDALDCYDRVLALEPRYVKALNNKANILDETGRFQEALDYYSEALQVDPKYGVACANRGALHYKLGNIRLALADFEHAANLDPPNLNGCFNAAAVYINQGDIEAALPYLEKAAQFGNTQAVQILEQLRGNLSTF